MFAVYECFVIIVSIAVYLHGSKSTQRNGCDNKSDRCFVLWHFVVNRYISRSV